VLSVANCPATHFAVGYGQLHIIEFATSIARVIKTELTGGTAGRMVLQEVPVPEIDSPDSVRADRAAIYRKAMEFIQHEYLEHTWQAFLRIAVNDDAPADVAKDLGISVWSVYQAKSRILRRLRREFKDF
jgi:RNA polymerase sigma-70 factor (ECF subfamily)